MKSITTLCKAILRNLCAAGAFLGSIPATAADNWPSWRGPHGDGCVVEEKSPLKWGADKVVWEAPVPGRGHSSPVIDRDRIFLTTADETAQEQSALGFDQATGALRWQTKLFEKGFDPKTHKRNSQASSTVACDGKRIYASFLNEGGIWIVALDYDGAELWRERVGSFTSFWGYSASPVLYGESLIVAADHSDGGYIAALDGQTGRRHWTIPRPKKLNYASPIIHRIGERDQLLVAGCDQLAAYDPRTGEALWSADATTEECVGTAVTDGALVFASGGFPKKETVGVRADGSGEVVWRNRVQTYVPSLLAHAGYLYTATDDGIVYCWEAATGNEKWKKRLGGTFNASPILAGENVYAMREDGTTFVFRANPQAFDLLAENKLGDNVYATPAFVGNRIYFRVGRLDGDTRRESLYCVGE